MTRITIDRTLQEKLAQGQPELELCDDSGRTIGYFLSPEVHHQLVYAWAKTLVTDEELEEARREPGGMTTEELLAYLRSLPHAETSR